MPAPHAPPRTPLRAPARLALGAWALSPSWAQAQTASGTLWPGLILGALLVAAAALVFLVLQRQAGRLPRWITAALPACLALAAVAAWLDALGGGSGSRPWPAVGLAAGGLGLVIGSIGLRRTGTRRGYHEPAQAEPEAPWFAITTIMDLHAQLPDDDALGTSQSYRAIHDAAAEAIITTNAQGVILSANPAAETLFGQRAVDMRGQSLAALVIDLDRLSAGPSSGAPPTLHGRPCEATARRRDGKTFPVELVTSRIAKSGSIAFITLLRDISERRQAENALRRSNELFRAILEGTRESLFLMDPAGHLLAVNETAARRLGRRAEELIGATVFEMLPPEVREPRRKVFFGVVASGQPAQLQEARAGRNFAVYYYPILDSLGKVSAVSVFAQDITDRTRAEDELREAHLQLREMTNELPCVVFQFTSDREARGRFTFVGGHVREIDHVDPEAILADPGLLLKDILPADRHLHIASLKRAASALAPWRSDFRVLASDGRIRWLHAAAVLRQGVDGAVVWNGYWIDITDRKLAEQTLAESSNLLQGILDGTAETLVLLDPLGNILAANTTAAHRVGETTESIKGRDFFSFFPVEISVERRAAFERSVATGRPQSLDDHREGRYYALNFYPIRDPQEQTQSVVLFALDITRAKETEISLRESEARFRQHLYGLPIEICICTVQGRVEYTNRQYLANIGYTQHDASTLAEWWALAAPDPDYRAEVSGRWREATLAVAGSDAAAAMPRAHLRCKDGVYRVFDIVARRMGEQYLVVFSNVTAREEAAAALQHAKVAAENAALARAQFLATMSHEIRTPLNGIIGMTELAIATATDAEQRRYLQLARSSSDSLLGLLNAVLDFSKIEAGRLHPEETSFDLRENVGEVLALLRPQAERKGITVHDHLDARLPERIISDPVRIRQILTNLLANAIKFTAQGEIGLSVEVEARDEHSCILHCRVRDTGIGIAEDRLQSIFTAFVQADGSITRRYGGTGLGLAICARLAEILGGSIWAESKLGSGSTFHCTLRAKLPPLAA